VTDVLEPPEFRTSSQLLDELRKVISESRYDNISVSELVGVLEMIKAETLKKWLYDPD